MIVRVNACTAAAWREQERIRRRAACVAGQLNNTWSLALRAPIFRIACRAGLFSHNGKLVLHAPRVENTCTCNNLDERSLKKNGLAHGVGWQGRNYKPYKKDPSAATINPRPPRRLTLPDFAVETSYTGDRTSTHCEQALIESESSYSPHPFLSRMPGRTRSYCT